MNQDCENRFTAEDGEFSSGGSNDIQGSLDRIKTEYWGNIDLLNQSFARKDQLFQQYEMEYPKLMSHYNTLDLTNETKFLIQIDESGKYVFKQWEDSNTSFDSDGMIFEVYKNQHGKNELIQWSMQEFYDIVQEA